MIDGLFHVWWNLATTEIRTERLATLYLLPQHGHGDVLVRVLLHDLRHRHFEILLGDVNATLTQCKHAWENERDAQSMFILLCKIMFCVC